MPSPDRQARRVSRIVGARPNLRGIVIGLAYVLLLLAGAATFVDPDVWHSMALARETLALGYIPRILARRN